MAEDQEDAWNREAFGHQEPLVALEDLGFAPRVSSRYAHLKQRRENSQAFQKVAGSRESQGIHSSLASWTEHDDVDLPNKDGPDGAMDDSAFASCTTSRYQNLRQRRENSRAFQKVSGPLEAASTKGHDDEVASKVGPDSATGRNARGECIASSDPCLPPRNWSSGMARSSWLRCARRAPTTMLRASVALAEPGPNDSTQSKLPVMPSAPFPKVRFLRTRHMASSAKGRALAPTLK